MATFNWKKALPALLGVTLACGLTPEAGAVGTWTTLTAAAPVGIGTMLLLTDGRVMAQSASDKTCYTLTPDALGSYVNGKWSAIAPMSGFRLYYTSAVLRNGDVLVSGGEYSDFGSDTNTSVIYHTLSNTWGTVPVPKHRDGSDWTLIGDAVSTTLSNGRLLMGDIQSPEQAVYDYVTNTWTASAGVKAVRSNEEAWTLQPDGSVLTVNCIGQADSGPTPENAERYVPGSDSWLNAGSSPAGHSLVDPNSSELGPGLLLPSGITLYIGATGHTALYVAPNTWVGGPDLYGSDKTLLLGAPDAPGCVEINGKALCLVSPASSSGNSFPNGLHFLEYTFDNGATNGSFAEAPEPSGNAFSQQSPSYVGRMLQLPNGQVLFTQGGRQLYAYTPDSGPNAAWKPAITSVKAQAGGAFLVTGTQFNGLTQGAYYGDDAQMASNYPLVRLTGAAGGVYYGRTFNHSTMGLATGGAVVTTTFTPPAALPAGNYSLQVVANGIASAGVAFTFSKSLALDSLTLSSASVTHGAPVTATVTLSGPAPAGGAKIAFYTSNAAVARPAQKNETIPAGSSSITFTVNTFTPGVVTFKVVYGSSERTIKLTVK